jgi:predicted RNase H-like nuclease (RuvC/YqgF family)
MKGNDIMKLISKIIGGVGVGAVATVGSFMLFSNDNVGASDEVTMELFNQLKARVETLETQNTELSNKIIELTNADVVINTEIDTVSSKVDTEVAKVKTDLTNKINNNTTYITNVTSRVTKTEAWQNKLFELETSPQGWNNTYIWLKMKEFMGL